MLQRFKQSAPNNIIILAARRRQCESMHTFSTAEDARQNYKGRETTAGWTKCPKITTASTPHEYRHL